MFSCEEFDAWYEESFLGGNSEAVAHPAESSSAAVAAVGSKPDLRPSLPPAPSVLYTGDNYVSSFKSLVKFLWRVYYCGCDSLHDRSGDVC